LGRYHWPHSRVTYIQRKAFVDEDPVGGAEYVLGAGALQQVHQRQETLMYVAIPRHVIEAQCLGHLLRRHATRPAIRHRQRCRHAERGEDHVPVHGARDVLVEVQGESVVGTDDDPLVIADRVDAAYRLLDGRDLRRDLHLRQCHGH